VGHRKLPPDRLEDFEGVSVRSAATQTEAQICAAIPSRSSAGQLGRPGNAVPPPVGAARHADRREPDLDRNMSRSTSPRGGDDRDGIAVGETLADPRAEEPTRPCRGNWPPPSYRRFLAQLSAREREIVCGRFGIGTQRRTLGELAGEARVERRARPPDRAGLAGKAAHRARSPRTRPMRATDASAHGWTSGCGRPSGPGAGGRMSRCGRRDSNPQERKPTGT
jgi:hypothetical protein